MNKIIDIKAAGIRETSDHNVSAATAAAQVIDRIKAAGVSIQLELPDSLDQIKQQILEREGRAARDSAARGMLYLTLKARIPHGEFLVFLAQHDLPHQRVYEDMQVARFCLALPEDARSKLLEFPQRSVFKLLALPPEVVDEKLEAGTLSKAKSYRELEEQVDRLSEEVDRWKRVTDRQHQTIVAGDEMSEPRGLTVVREEALLGMERVLAELSILKEVFDRLLATKTNDAADVWRFDGGHILNTALDSIMGAASALSQINLKRFGPMVEDTEREYRLTAMSAERFEKQRKAMLAEVEAAAGKRAELRHKKHGWRGAPPKSLEGAITGALNAERKEG